jgi:drug/metabolite transporter (DMT)-like permease
MKHSPAGEGLPDPTAGHIFARHEIGFWTAVYMMLLCTLFGANAVAIKVAFEGFGIFSAAALRFGMAALVITLWAQVSGRSFRLQSGQWKPLLVYSMLFTMQLSLFFAGIDRTYASRGTLLINLLPFLILVLAHFFIPGDQITRRNLVGLILGFGGVVCVFAGPETLAGDMRSGDVLVLAATVIWAANTVFIKRVIDAFDPFHIVLYSMLFALPFFALEAWLFDAAIVKTLSLRSLTALAYQAFVTASFGFIAWNTLLKTYGAVALHSFVFIMPLVGVVLSGWLLDEPLPPSLWLALVLIVVGILVVHFKTPHALTPLPLRRHM